jgi:hypothetical protein
MKLSQLRRLIREIVIQEARRLSDAAPPGWEGTVKAMKKHPEIENPWALAWSMKKKGYKPHKK